MSTGRKHGGARKGAGRKPGARGIRTREALAKAESIGVKPLDVMLEAMAEHYEVAKKMAKGPERLVALRAAHEFAKDAAPYIHPKLAATEVSGRDGGAIEVEHKVVLTPQ